MDRSDIDMKRIFSEETELPEIVREKKLEAYDRIHDQMKGREDGHGRNEGKRIKTINKAAKNGSQFWQRVSKVAIIILACILVLGSSAVATTIILNRYERMKRMEQGEKEEISQDIEQNRNLGYVFSRKLTDDEQSRLELMRTVYKYNEAFPEHELKRLAEEENYSGEGVALSRIADERDILIYLPERVLTDEELLEIVEYEQKQRYVFLENGAKKYAESSEHARRLTELTDEDVDYYYLAMNSHRKHVSGGYCREVDGVFHGGSDNVGMLTEAEEEAYKEMERQYVEEDRMPEREAVVIDTPEEFTGERVSVCRYDGNFYLPSRELTEEDLLQIVDFRKKEAYVFQRIGNDIQIGKRTGWPKIPEK